MSHSKTLTGNVEIVKVTALSSNTLTVVRAQDNTSARAFSTADKCELRLTAAGLNEVASQADTDTNTTYSIGDGGLTTNDFTNADHSKLNAIEASATADQTNAEIRTAVEAATDSNVFTDADHTKLGGIATNANNYVLPSSIATQSYVGTQISNLVDSSPATLNTLNELAAALGDDPNFATTVSATSIGTKLPLAGGTLTGTLTVDAGSSGMIDFGNVTTAYGRLYADNSGTYIGSKSNHPLILRSNHTAALTLDTSQNATFAGTISSGAITSNGQSLFKGADTSSTAYASQFQNSVNTTLFRVRNDGVILIPSNYLYVQHSGGIYSTGSIKARGGITNDGSNNLSISSGGSDIEFNSKNFTSVGTISSGAIQGSSTIDSTNVTTGTFRVYDGSTFRGGLGTGQWASGSTSQVGNWSLYAVGTLNLHSNDSGVPQVTQTSSGFNSTIPYQINGTTVIDANRQIFAKTGTQVGEDGTYGGYGVLGFGGITNGYNRVFGRDDNGDGLFLASATGRGVFVRTNGAGSDTFSFTSAGEFKVGATTVIDASRNIRIPLTSKLYFGGGNHTYISEDIDDRLRFFAGGAEFMRFTESSTNTVSIYQDISHAGNFTTDGYVQHAGVLYSRNTLNVLNTAGNGWSSWATRGNDTFNLSVGTISSGAITSTGSSQLQALTVKGGTSSTAESILTFENTYDTAHIKSKYTNPSSTTETYLAFYTNKSGESNGTVSESMRLSGNNLSVNGTVTATGGNSTNWNTAYTVANAALPKAGGTMTGMLNAGGGINGLTLSNGISGSNFDITGVNQLTINDPGEGIVFGGGSTTMSLAIVDDATDRILRYSGTGAVFDVQGNITATGLTVSKASESLANQPSIISTFDSSGTDGLALISIEHLTNSGASALGAGLRFQVGDGSTGTADKQSYIFQRGGGQLPLVYIADKSHEFYVDHHDNNIDGTSYADYGTLALTLTEVGNVVAAGTVTATGGNSTNWNTAYGWGNHASAGYTNDQTAAEILTAIKTVDGAGSGLDADLLDGVHGASILKV